MIAVISDIHGNFWALQAVLHDLDRLGPSQVIVAGDLALGGPRPGDCLTLIRQRGYPAIRGNTDEWLTKAPGEITDAITWTSAQLPDSDRRYLVSLPFLWRYPDDAGDLVVVHATPWSIADAVGPDAPEDIVSRVFAETGAAAVVYGHIHIAYVREALGKVLVNAGSVGLPFDGDQRASYVLMEARSGKWEATPPVWPTMWQPPPRRLAAVRIRIGTALRGVWNGPPLHEELHFLHFLTKTARIGRSFPAKCLIFGESRVISSDF